LHWQLPLKQLLPTPPQGLPHAPQLFTSNCTKVQTPPQLVEPNWHCMLQLPKLHTCPLPHTWPQVPQLLGSCWVRTQVPLQGVAPIPHRQLPPTQLPSAPQATLHAPQLALSLCGLTQVPAQLT